MRIMSHISALRQFLESELPAQRETLYAESQADLAKTSK